MEIDQRKQLSFKLQYILPGINPNIRKLTGRMIYLDVPMENTTDSCRFTIFEGMKILFRYEGTV
jgi:hypothetical protein